MESRSIPGYEGRYTVFEDGRIWSFVRGGKFLRGGKSSGGYPQVELTNVDGAKRTWLIHQLVALAFIGPYPTPKHQIDHVDGNKRNNHRTNLEYVTGSENCKRAWKLGLSKPPTHQQKLTEDQVRIIRTTDLHDLEYSIEFGVARDTVRDARNGRTFKQLDVPPRIKGRLKTRTGLHPQCDGQRMSTTCGGFCGGEL